MRVALYARVSTTNGQDPEMQLRELREYCERRGWTMAGEYVDTGISGAREKRPELDRMMADAHRRRSLFACLLRNSSVAAPLPLSSFSCSWRPTFFLALGSILWK